MIAGGATFAAFPVWYATMFSGFYLALLAHPRPPDRPRALVRVAREGRGGGWQAVWAWLEHDRVVRRAAPLGHRAREPAPRRPDRLRPDLRGRLRRPLQRVLDRRGHRPLPPLRPPRRGLPHAPHARRPARSAQRASRARLAPARGRRRRGLPRLDARRRGRRERQGASSPASCPSRSPRSPPSPRSSSSGRGTSAGRSSRRRRRSRAAVVTLFVSLYPRVMVSDPDFGNSLTVENASSAALLAHRDDGRRGRAPPGRAALPGVDVPRVPRAARRRGRRQPRSTCVAPKTES